MKSLKCRRAWVWKRTMCPSEDLDMVRETALGLFLHWVRFYSGANDSMR